MTKEEEKISLMKQLSELSGRASGRTTRLVDHYIQELYNNEGTWIMVADHYDNPLAHRMLAEKILERMAREHPHDKVSHNFSKKEPQLRLDECWSNKFIIQEMNRISKELGEL